MTKDILSAHQFWYDLIVNKPNEPVAKLADRQS